jgi:hypothetical protein
VQKITEKVRLHSLESQDKVFPLLILLKIGSITFTFHEVLLFLIASFIQEQEVLKLKKQLNEFIEERRGWAIITSRLLNIIIIFFSFFLSLLCLSLYEPYQMAGRN